MLGSTEYNPCFTFTLKKQSKKDTLSSLKQFLATESPLKKMKNAFYLTLKSFRSQDIQIFVSILVTTWETNTHFAKDLKK